MGTDKRQRQKEGHRIQREEMLRQQKRRQTRRRATLFIGAVVVFFGLLYGVSLLQDDGDDSEAVTTTTLDPRCPPVDGVDEPVTTFDAAPPMCIDPTKTYTAVMDTSEGEIRIDLDTENTPSTANNFIFLARNKYYDDNPVFRTDPSIGIFQAGGASRQSNPGYTIPDEGEGFTYEPGQIVMARGEQPNSGSAQFFLVGTDAASDLDANGKYVVFGTTDQAGIDVTNAILALHQADPTDPLGGRPNPDVTINSVTIEES